MCALVKFHASFSHNLRRSAKTTNSKIFQILAAHLSVNATLPEGLSNKTEGWNWKWKLLGGASIIFGTPLLLVAALKYDPETRDFVEALFPDQVEFLRKRVTFEKEDIEHLKYIRNHNIEYRSPASAIVHFQGGQKTFVADLDPSESYDEFKKRISASEAGRILTINFLDLNKEIPDPDEVNKSDMTSLAHEQGYVFGSLEAKGSQQHLHPLEVETNTISLWQKYVPAAKEKGSLESVFSDKNLSLEEAKLRLRSLDFKEKELEKEKMVGIRAIDDIDLELNAIRQRKKNIKQAYFRRNIWKWF